jgi:hypothetical protein
VNIKLNGVAEFKRKYAGLSRQVTFAQAIALNRTAELVNAGVRGQMRQRFNIREPRFLPPVQLPRGDQATRTSLEARVVFFDAMKAVPRGRVGGGEGLAQRRGAILSKFEGGGLKQSSRLGLVAIPTRRIRSTPMQKIPAQLFPVNLRLGVSRRDIDGGILPSLSVRKLGNSKRLTAQGLNGRTYFLDTRNGVYGIYERVTDRRGGAERNVPPRLVWVFRPSVRIPAKLGFYDSARATYRANIGREMQSAMEFAIRTARVRQ